MTYEHQQTGATKLFLRYLFALLHKFSHCVNASIRENTIELNRNIIGTLHPISATDEKTRAVSIKSSF